MLDYDMLDVEACGLKDEDQGHYPCSVWGEGEKEQDKRRSIYDRTGKTRFIKERGHLMAYNKKVSWEQLWQRQSN